MSKEGYILFKIVEIGWVRIAIQLMAPDNGRELRTLSGHSERVRDVALSEDGRRAVSASDDKTLKVWDLESGRELRGKSRLTRFLA